MLTEKKNADGNVERKKKLTEKKNADGTAFKKMSVEHGDLKKNLKLFRIPEFRR